METIIISLIGLVIIGFVLYKLGQKDRGRKDELDALEYQNKVQEISQEHWVKDEPLLATRRKLVHDWLRKKLQGKSSKSS